MNTDLLTWLQDWYGTHCNGEWEQENGVAITTVDNPGWWVKIDLRHTPLERYVREYEFVENSESDWYAISVEDFLFDAAGDPSKLNFLLQSFRDWAEECATKKA